MTYTIQIDHGDWRFDEATGQVVEVEGQKKTSQDIREFLTVEVLANGFGAGLDELLGYVDEPLVIQALMRSNISQGITRIQQLQARYQRAQRTGSERISGLAELVVGPSSRDQKTGFVFRVKVQTFDGKTVGPLAGVLYGS